MWPRLESTARSQALIERLRELVPTLLTASGLELGDAVISVDRQHLRELFGILKADESLQFACLLSVTVIDWMDRRQQRFEVVYHFLSHKFSDRLRLKVPVPESDPIVDSAVDFWLSANFMEREAWDMVGVNFRGHPNQQRILMYEEFIGHPLRKDYPIQGKQPRVALRAPEVQNTALAMNRSPLVAINKRPPANSSTTI